MKHVLDNYTLSSMLISCVRYGDGHINETYLVETATDTKYILQKINDNVFRNVDGLMSNVEKVTAYLGSRVQDYRETLHLLRTNTGETYYSAPDGTYWRIYEYVENSICLQRPESPKDFYESAVAFGRFQQMLKDFPADTLVETIPNFHNTPDRYRIFKNVLAADVMGRAAQVASEIDFALAHEDEASTLQQFLYQGKLPLRVTHNDTKFNNVMLDASTRTALCVIDLDTVMPGLSVNDFGDSIRFGASTAAEDEQDLKKVEMSLELFEIYTKGFLQACPDLTPLEREMLPMGAKLMTLECGLRFLTDYLDGDHYFSTSRPGQNLDRCRTQFKLVADMEQKWEQMHKIVEDASK